MNKGYPTILAAYVGWGLFPLYWSLLTHVPPLEVLLHRMFWAVPFLALIVVLAPRRRAQFAAAFRSWREMRLLLISSLYICVNWGIFIWAVANHRVVEASMGYFLTPFLNVLTGLLVFRERLNRIKIIAIGFAAAGVIYYIFSAGQFPWVGLSLGASFALYGLLRKKMETNAIPGLLIETLILLPFTIGSILWLHHQGTALFLNFDSGTDILLILAGPVTVIPLALFTAGTRLLPMISIGILFYVTPSLVFLCGVLVLGESVNGDKLTGFIGIWIGLILFTYSLIKDNNEAKPEFT